MPNNSFYTAGLLGVIHSNLTRNSNPDGSRQAPLQFRNDH